MKTHVISNPIAGVFTISSLAITLTLTPSVSIAAHHMGGAFGGRAFGERSFGERTFGMRAEGHMPTAPHESTMLPETRSSHQFTRSHIEDRFDRLNDRLEDHAFSDKEFKERHDHIVRTRIFLFTLLDIRTPDFLVIDWADALADDEILVGMPSDLVLDFWGHPIVIEQLVLDGRHGEVWTFHPRLHRTVKVTVFNHRVTDVRRV